MNQKRIFTDLQKAEKSTYKVEDINVALELFLLGFRQILIEEMNSAS